MPFVRISFVALGKGMVCTAAALLVLSSPAYTQTSELELPPLPTGSPQGIHECVDFALRENPQVKVARARMEEAAGTLITAQAGLFPQLTSGGLYQIRETQYATSTNPNRSPEDWNVNVRITQNVYSAGKVRSQVAAAKLREQAVYFDYLKELDDTILNVRVAFFAVLLARQKVEIYALSVSLAEQQLAEQNRMAAAGTVGEVNVLRAEVTLANAQPAYIRAQARVRETLVELARVMGYKLPDESAAEGFNVEGSLVFDPPQYDLSSALARAEILRPEIKAAMKNIEALQQLVTVEKSANRPRFDVFASYETLNDTDESTDLERIQGGTVGVVGSWQIFDGFNARGRVQVVNGEIEAATAQLTGLQLTVESEVRNAFIDLDRARKILSSQGKAVELATKSFNAIELGVKEGLNSQLDSLQARDQLVIAELVLADARHDLAVAAARLDRVIGHEILVSGLDGPKQLPGMEAIQP